MAARLLKKLLPLPRAHRRRRRDEQRAGGGNLRELEQALCRLAVQHEQLQARVAILETLEDHVPGRLYEGTMAAHGLRPAQRVYEAEPAAHVALAVASAEGAIGDG